MNRPQLIFCDHLDLCLLQESSPSRSRTHISWRLLALPITLFTTERILRSPVMCKGEYRKTFLATGLTLSLQNSWTEWTAGSRTGPTTQEVFSTSSSMQMSELRHRMLKEHTESFSHQGIELGFLIKAIWLQKSSLSCMHRFPGLCALGMLPWSSTVSLYERCGLPCWLREEPEFPW